jgi:tRNA(Ile)-lysidine synthase
MDLQQKFQKHIVDNFPFLKNKKLLIAASGGIDSTVCIHLLRNLNFKISLAHCNFNLRKKDSGLDELFVKEEAQSLDFPYYVKSFDTVTYANDNKISVQLAARELRYEWFDELISQNDFDHLITAHHLDDSLETFLINFTRGTGLDGLTGIPAINDNIIRPLLPFTREEIEAYAKKNNLTWREDSSNLQTKYLRNKLRHDLIPILKDLNQNFMNTFARTLDNLRGSEQIIKDRIESIADEIEESQGDIHQFNISKIKKLSNPKAYLFEILKGYGFKDWKEIVSLLDAQSGKQIFSKTHRLVKNRDLLLLIAVESKEESSTSIINENDKEFISKDLCLKFDKSNFQPSKNGSKTSITVDKNMLKFPLVVRKWEKGDYFYPAGMKGKKKLSKYFKDEKMSILEKEKIWLLCTEENKIIWIIGKRLDDRFKVTKETIEILKIENEKFT